METEQHQESTSDLRNILSENFTVSKRQLGIIFICIGVLGFIGILAIDLVGGGREGGIGPAQSAALIAMIGVTVLGITLLPLGDKPA